MATNTDNLNLKKPAQEDFYNVDDFNENFEKIDNFAGRKDNPHGVTKSQVGLGKVDNTSDAEKPVSTAQANAIESAKKAGTDAQNGLNTHTANKSNPHNVTVEQIGAVQRGIWMFTSKSSDSLYDYIKSKTDEGYTQGVIQVNASSGIADIPENLLSPGGVGTHFLCTFQKHYYQYVRVTLHADSSLYEYTNRATIKTGGTWETEWTQKMHPKGYLPLIGGTVKGSLTINTNWASLGLTDEGGRKTLIEKNPSTNYTSIYSYKDNDNHNCLMVSPEGINNLDNLLFRNVVGGVATVHKVLHTGNISELGIPQIVKGSYTGDGTNNRTISIDFNPKLVIIEHYSSNAHCIFIKTANGTMGVYVDSSDNAKIYYTRGHIVSNGFTVSNSRAIGTNASTNFETPYGENNANSGSYTYVAIG